MTRSCTALVFAAWFLVSGTARAQNLLTNPNFDAGLSGWTGPAGVFDPTRDANGNPLSGSAQVSPPGAFCDDIQQCVNVTAGGIYELTGRLLFPSGTQFNSGPGSASILFGFYDAACGSQSFSLVGAPVPIFIPNSGPSEVWNPQTLTATAPAGALSAFVIAQTCAATPANATANFDNLDFELIGFDVVSVPTLGRACIVLLAALLAAAGVLAVRWRLS